MNSIDSEFRLQQTALNLRSYRQGLLASNIANADTPHYAARDIDFKSALTNALGGRAGGTLAMARTAGNHLDGAGASPFAAETRFRSEFQSSADGNTVNIDVERASFAENAIQIEALLTFMRQDIKEMQLAITGQ